VGGVEEGELALGWGYVGGHVEENRVGVEGARVKICGNRAGEGGGVGGCGGRAGC